MELIIFGSPFFIEELSSIHITQQSGIAFPQYQQAFFTSGLRGPFPHALTLFGGVGLFFSLNVFFFRKTFDKEILNVYFNFKIVSGTMRSFPRTYSAIALNLLSLISNL